MVPAGIEERWAIVSGNRMRYLFGGSGPPLLLVHGLGGFSFSWSENLPVFSEHFTVYAPDLLNVGYSARARLNASLQSTASQLAEFMAAAGIGTADVIGTSYGGTAAMMLAAIAPERVRRLILVAPAHCGSESSRWQASFFSTRFGSRFAQLLRFAPAFLHGYIIRQMYAEPKRALPGTVEEYAAALRLPGTIPPMVELMRCWTRNFKALGKMMPNIENIPTLLVWGDRDFVVPVSTSQHLMHCFRDCRLAVINDAGHLPYEELPEEFNRIVLDFLLQR